MPLLDLDYQARVLVRLDDYLTELSARKAKADKIIAANATETDPDLIRPVPDFPAKIWQILRTAGKLPPSQVNIPYSPRKDGIGRDVPNIVLKVPTGGGKIYLAVSALSRIFGRYLGQSTGLVLWIVPNEAIYSQTKRPPAKAQTGNRVVVLELKGEHLYGNPDTDYKQAVLQLMTETFQAGQVDRIGELELVGGDGTQVECDLVLASEWQARLAQRLHR